MMLLNKKSIQFIATNEFNRRYGPQADHYITIAMQVLVKHPVDMLVFEMADATHLQVRLAGYDLATDSILDEKTVAYTCSEHEMHYFRAESSTIDTFWLKIDRDEAGNYIGTFLFPEDY